MSRTTLTRRGRLAAAGLAAAVAVATPYAATHAAEPDPPATTTTDMASPQHRKIVSLMHHMSLQQKIGQLFVIEVYGRDANNVSDTAKAGNQRLYGVDTPAQAIAKYQPGGVIYFTTRGPDNIGDAAQVAKLSNGLQSAALQQRPKIPLNIAVDQEGGALVARFGPASGATQMPGQMALGAGGSTEDAARSAEVIGTELAAVGVTQDYAPVADVNLNPNNPVIGIRSAGADSAAVSDIVEAEVGGFDDGGLSSIAKHFPGHGDTGTDSHYGLPEVTHSREELEAIDLPPFKAAIDAG
ncbi:MAG TPA: glycoside hydrolase family 3 N-terminal domain-containing protein, partial [Nocardioides sp.]